MVRCPYGDCRSAGSAFEDDEAVESARKLLYDCVARVVLARGWRRVAGRGELRARRRKHCELDMMGERRQAAFEELSRTKERRDVA